MSLCSLNSSGKVIIKMTMSLIRKWLHFTRCSLIILASRVLFILRFLTSTSARYPSLQCRMISVRGFCVFAMIFSISFASSSTSPNMRRHTSVCFCVPVWFSQKYWRQLTGFRVLDYFPEGSDVFTSPDYWRQNSESPYPEARVFRGATKWGTVVLYHPPATVHRDEGRRLGEGGQNTASAGWLQRLQVLSGDQFGDTVLLREMSKTCM